MASPPLNSQIRPKRILIIGGGPAGLVTLRNLTDYGDFEHVELVERRADIGGVWNLEDETDTGDDKPKWPSPAYPGLIGNVLPEFLSYAHHPFPKPPSPHQPFPTLVETYEYLRAFAEPFAKNIRLNIEVTSVDELENSSWKVSMRDWNGTGEAIEETWDAVVVAVGWFDNPVWPQAEGLDELVKTGLATHAKVWRGRDGYEKKKILIVGNANSANDIAAELAPVASTPIYQSARRPPFPGFPSLPDDRIVTVGPVLKYTPSGSAHLKDGTEIHDIERVIIATGYRPYPGFIRVLSPSDRKTLAPLVSPSTQPHRIPSVHRHIMYAHNPTLAFVGSTMCYTPFTVADVSSAWLTLAWTGEIPYPDSVEGRLAFEKERLEAIEKWREGTEDPTSFLVYSVLAASEEEYARGLKEDVLRARKDVGEALPEWNEAATKRREGTREIKLEALRYARDHLPTAVNEVTLV